MSSTALLILQLSIITTMSGLTNGQFGGSGGGPSSFGYDGSSACSKPYSRNSRARFEKLPCDFRRQNWCTVAGSAYPWHAVRRFVQENQGLMRRMYGDEKHINVLKAELEKNDIEIEFDDRYQRYPEESRRFQYEDAYEFMNLEKQRGSKSADEAFEEERRFTGNEDEGSEIERTRKHKKTLIKSNEGEKSSNESSIVVNSGSSMDSQESSLENSSKWKSTLSVEVNSSTERIESMKNPSSNPGKSTTTISPLTLADIAKIKNSSINEIPGLSDFYKTELPIFSEPTIIPRDENMESNTESTTSFKTSSKSSLSISSSLSPTPSLSTSTPSSLSTSSSTILSSSTSSALKSTSASSSTPSTTSSSASTSSSLPIISSVSSTSPEIDRIDINSKDSSSGDQVFPTNEQEPQQQFRPRPEYRPSEKKPEMVSIEGQLFQDVAAKDQQEAVLNFRGVNACPVKEEVVAPFWANNTRGEVLALLNLYPFEQYVHWEKCEHENKQMYCRNGCKCEQQYRLHRLLAYDPSNECRGIFSDWFKFPSCCVCRCYDLPVEFRVTSRSPRIQKQKLKLRAPGHDRG